MYHSKSPLLSLATLVSELVVVAAAPVALTGLPRRLRGGSGGADARAVADLTAGVEHHLLAWS